jgi:hypothetical protein
MGSSADIAGGAVIIPIDSSDAINVRNIMVVSLKTRLWWRSRYAYKLSVIDLFLVLTTINPKAFTTFIHRPLNLFRT